MDKLREHGEEDPVIGHHWLEGFVRRNPSVQKKIGKVQEAARFKAFTPKAVNWYFDILEQYSWIKKENIVNMDEGGIMNGVTRDSLRLGGVETRKAMVKSDQGRSWTTFIEAVTADGRLLEPGIIFKGVNLQVQWFDAEVLKQCEG